MSLWFWNSIGGGWWIVSLMLATLFVWLFPRLILVWFFMFAGTKPPDTWHIVAGMFALGIAFESAKDRWPKRFNMISCLIRGKEFIVEKEVVVEKEVEKIIYQEKIVAKAVRFPRELTQAEAFEVLGIKPGGDVEAAYRKQIKLVHPDLGGSHYLSKLVNESRRILSA